MTGMVEALFEAAVEAGGDVERFVLTSSSTAVYRAVDLSKGEYTEDDWNTVTLEEVLSVWDPAETYSASKTFGERRLWELTAEVRPGFEVVVLCPPSRLPPPHTAVAVVEGC